MDRHTSTRMDAHRAILDPIKRKLRHQSFLGNHKIQIIFIRIPAEFIRHLPRCRAEIIRPECECALFLHFSDRLIIMQNIGKCIARFLLLLDFLQAAVDVQLRKILLLNRIAERKCRLQLLLLLLQVRFLCIQCLLQINLMIQQLANLLQRHIQLAE